MAARDEFARIGATGWGNRLNEELCPCRGEPRETAGLTPTEQKVADLIVTGRRTKEVAAALYLSPKTVELPLTRVYRKYGVRSGSNSAHGWWPDTPEPAQRSTARCAELAVFVRNTQTTMPPEWPGGIVVWSLLTRSSKRIGGRDATPPGRACRGRC